MGAFQMGLPYEFVVSEEPLNIDQCFIFKAPWYIYFPPSFFKSRDFVFSEDNSFLFPAF